MEYPIILKRAVLKEELLYLTGNFSSAIILQQCIYWQIIKMKSDELLREEESLNIEFGDNVSPEIYREGWWYKRAESLNDEIMLNLDRHTIRDKISEFINAGWMVEKKIKGGNQTKHYRIVWSNLESDLNKIGCGLESKVVLDKEKFRLAQDNFNSKLPPLMVQDVASPMVARHQTNGGQTTIGHIKGARTRIKTTTENTKKNVPIFSSQGSEKSVNHTRDLREGYVIGADASGADNGSVSDGDGKVGTLDDFFTQASEKPSKGVLLTPAFGRREVLSSGEQQLLMSKSVLGFKKPATGHANGKSKNKVKDPVPEPLKQLFFKLCFLSDTTEKQKLLGTVHHIRVVNVINALKSAGQTVDMNSLVEFHKWWKSFYKSRAVTTKQYCPPSPEQVKEHWLQAFNRERDGPRLVEKEPEKQKMSEERVLWISNQARLKKHAEIALQREAREAFEKSEREKLNNNES